jgi:hypothetical protein
MDWSQVITGVVGGSPVAGVLALAWWQAAKRADKWEDAYISDSREFLKVSQAAEQTLRLIHEEVRK